MSSWGPPWSRGPGLISPLLPPLIRPWWYLSNNALANYSNWFPEVVSWQSCTFCITNYGTHTIPMSWCDLAPFKTKPHYPRMYLIFLLLIGNFCIFNTRWSVLVLSDAANRNQGTTGSEDNTLRNDDGKKIGWLGKLKKSTVKTWSLVKDTTVSMMTLIVNQVLKCHEIKIKDSAMNFQRVKQC